MNLSKRDQERFARATAAWDNGGWTQYRDSEPMAGHVANGSIEHAVLESAPVRGGNVCTRHTLCGQLRCAVLARATKRAFDADMPRPRKPCAICLRLIGPFREWQSANPPLTQGAPEVKS